MTGKASELSPLRVNATSQQPASIKGKNRLLAFGRIKVTGYREQVTADATHGTPGPSTAGNMPQAEETAKSGLTADYADYAGRNLRDKTSEFTTLASERNIATTRMNAGEKQIF